VSSVEQGDLFSDSPAKDPLARRAAEQRAAVLAPADCHLRIQAGPGAGKTHVLMERLRHLLGEGLTTAELSIITYTNSARDELRDRLTGLMGEDQDLPFIGTIHQFCLRLVHAQLGVLGIEDKVRVLDPVQAERVFAAVFGSESTEDPARLYARLSLAWDAWHGSGQRPCSDSKPWERFDARLRKLGLATFTSLQLWALEAIEAGAARLSGQLLIDEYQDTTGLQVRVLEALAERGTRITVVGDWEQSIFGFAGADPSQLADFHERFTPCTSRSLWANGRSAARLVELSSRLRGSREAQFALRPPGERPRLVHVSSESQQAQVVVDGIEVLLSRGDLGPGDVAVLGREGHPAAIVEGLLSLGLPVYLPKGERFESRPHVRNLILCLEALADPTSVRAWFFFFDQVVRGGPKTWEAVLETLEGAGDLDEAVAQALEQVSRPRQSSLHQLLAGRKTCLEIAQMPEAQQRLHAIYERLLKPRFGLRERKMQAEIEADLERVLAVAEDHPEPAGFADWLRQGGLSPDQAGERVTVATLHYAKGREWKAVFLIDLTRGVLPHRKNPDPDEERRLLHVGVSRAADHLTLVAPQRLPGRGEGPSPLLKEIRDLCQLTDLRG
jgi:DNA helicase-2/ATP-dependent DNA helicase PcrA